MLIFQNSPEFVQPQGQIQRAHKKKDLSQETRATIHETVVVMDSQNPKQKLKFDKQGTPPLERADFYFKTQPEAFKEQFFKTAGADAEMLWTEFAQDYDNRMRIETFKAEKDLGDRINSGMSAGTVQRTTKRNEEGLYEEIKKFRIKKVAEPNEFLENPSKQTSRRIS